MTKTLSEKVNELAIECGQDVKRLDNLINNIPFNNSSSSYYNWVRQFVSTRGNGMVNNYSGLWGNNFNFSGFTLDRRDKPEFCYSSWTFQQVNVWRNNDEFMGVNPEMRYYYSFWAKRDDVSSYPDMKFVPYIACYDLDKKQIEEYMESKLVVTTVVEATPSHNNIVLTQDSYDALKSFITDTRSDAFHYYLNHETYTTDSGYVYSGNYSRSRYGVLYEPNITFNDGKKSISGLSIVGGNIPVGTKIGIGIFRKNSDSMKAVKLSSMIPTEKISSDWTKYQTNFGRNDLFKGTAYIRLMWRNELPGAPSSTQSLTKISNIILREKIIEG